MTVHIHKPTRLPPFGRCIYCNASDENGPLTSEHVVPFFLGGNLEIDEASCRDCQKITTKIEGHCAYKVFHQYRHGVGIKSRRSIPQSIPVIFHTNAGPSVRQVPLGDQPQIMTLPIFPEPGMLEGRTPKQQMQPEIMTAWVSQAIEERFERSKREGDEGYSLDAEYDVDIFARFIAKIGIAASVAILGFEPTSSWLGPLVRGLDKNVDYLIGTLFEPSNNVKSVTALLPRQGDVHLFGFEFRAQPSRTEGVVVARIKFFEALGSPTYLAVVGPMELHDYEKRIAATQSVLPERTA